MGADIHIFTEFIRPSHDLGLKKWESADFFLKEGEDFGRIQAYEGRNTELFDLLQSDIIPQNGAPHNPSKEFLAEFKGYSFPYGLNHIELYDLVEFFLEQERRDIIRMEDKFSSVSYILYPLVQDLYTHFRSLVDSYTISPFLQHSYFRVIYFFER